MAKEDKIKFWLRVKARAEEKLGRLHGSSQRCPCCKVWSHTLEKQPEWTVGDNDTLLMICSNCNNVSRWIDIGFAGLHHCVEPFVESTGDLESRAHDATVLIRPDNVHDEEYWRIRNIISRTMLAKAKQDMIDANKE